MKVLYTFCRFFFAVITRLTLSNLIADGNAIGALIRRKSSLHQRRSSLLPATIQWLSSHTVTRTPGHVRNLITHKQRPCNTQTFHRLGYSQPGPVLECRILVLPCKVFGIVRLVVRRVLSYPWCSDLVRCIVRRLLNTHR